MDKWIKGINNNTNSVGLTFEEQLGKKPDSMYFPDFYGIEIKTTTRFSRYPFTLFSIAFDGPDLYETNRILQQYGKIDYYYKDKKTLIGSINTNEPIKLSKYSFKLDIDNNDKKLYLCIYDENNNMIERKSYINFNTIIDRMRLKLSNLVVVYASKKKIDNDLYYRYYAYKQYKLKDDIDIIKLIEDNIIKVVLMCRVSRSGEDEGRQRNKTFSLQIDKDNITKLFNIVDDYNHDDSSTTFNIL